VQGKNRERKGRERKGANNEDVKDCAAVVSIEARQTTWERTAYLLGTKSKTEKESPRC